MQTCLQRFGKISARTKEPLLLRLAKVNLWNKYIILNLFKIAMAFYLSNINNRPLFAYLNLMHIPLQTKSLAT